MKQRFLEWCRWLQWGAWTFERGIDIDQDGDIRGSGFMFRLESPRWLRRWAARQLPPSTEEELRFRRADISDVLLESLLRPTMFPTGTQGDFQGGGFTWTEDELQ